MKKLIGIAATLLALQTCEVIAAGAPSQLRGKSLALSWRDQRVEKIVSTGQERGINQSSDLTVYVGAEGRFFSQFSRATAKSSSNLKEVSGAGRNELSWRVDGKALAADQPFKKGVRRLIVSFDDSYSNCTLRVLHGKEAGSSNLEYITFGDKQYVILQSINVTSTSCAIRTGNPFASQ